MNNALDQFIYTCESMQIADEALAELGLMTILCAGIGLPIAAYIKLHEDVFKNSNFAKKNNKNINTEYSNFKKEYEERNRLISEDDFKRFAIKKVNEAKADIKKSVAKINSSKDTLAEITNKVEKAAKSWDCSNKYKIVYDDSGDYIEIIDADQGIRIDLSYIVEDIAKAISAKYHEDVKYGLISVDSGDGDEGCIYIESKYI